MSELNTGNFANIYRPKTFSEVVGQDLAVSALKKIAHADGITVRSILLKGSWGSGKCISGDQRVDTALGYFKISFLCPGAPEGFTEFKIKVASPVAKDNIAETSHFYKESNAKLLHLVTESGREYTGTFRHMIFSSKRGRLGMYPCASLSVGDRIVKTIRPVDVCDRDESRMFELAKIYCRDLSEDPLVDLDVIPFVNHSRAWFFLAGVLDSVGRFTDGMTPEMFIPRLSKDFTTRVCDLLDYLSIFPSIRGDFIVVSGFALAQLAELWNRTIRDTLSSKFKELGGFKVGSNASSGTLLSYEGIVNIYETVETVYDLTVPDGHLFYSMGVVNHNTTTARIFGKALNCEHFKENDDVCNECPRCLDASTKTSQLYMELDATSVGNVDAIRNLSDRLSIAPNGRRLVVIDEIHAASTQALNALLKILEDGVPNTIFLFATTENILPTIQSRSLCIDIGTVPLDILSRRVREIADSRGIKISDQSLSILAMKSQGHMRDALQLLQLYDLSGDKGLESSYFKFRNFVINVLSKNPKEDPASILSEILRYPTSDIKMSIGTFIRNIFTSEPGTVENKLYQVRVGKSLFGFFFSPTAQQALRSEIGTEILLRTFLEKSSKKQ